MQAICHSKNCCVLQESTMVVLPWSVRRLSRCCMTPQSWTISPTSSFACMKTSGKCSTTWFAQLWLATSTCYQLGICVYASWVCLKHMTLCGCNGSSHWCTSSTGLCSAFVPGYQSLQCIVWHLSSLHDTHQNSVCMTTQTDGMLGEHLTACKQ